MKALRVLLAVHTVCCAPLLVLTDQNFTEVVEVEGSKVLVQFYAPWCSYCKRLAPAWADAAQLVADIAAEDTDGFVGRLAVVDAIEHITLARRFRVTSYPTLKWFVDGEALQYRGSLSAHDIADWVISRGGRHVRMLRDASAVEAFKLSHAVTFVAELAPSRFADGTAMHALTEAARRVEVPCGLANTSEGAERLVLTRALDEAEVLFKRPPSGGGALDAQGLREFITANALPPVLRFDEASELSLFKSELHHVLLLFEDDGAPPAVGERGKVSLTRACEGALRGRVLCTTVGMSEVRHKPMHSFLLEPSPPALPAAVVFDKEHNLRYPFSGTLSPEALTEFVLQVQAGHVRPLLLGEAATAAGTHAAAENAVVEKGAGARGVEVLVGSTYMASVLGGARDTVVLFYAPWCVRCEEAASAFEALARRLVAKEHVRFARIDVSRNEVPAPRLASLPAVFLFCSTARRLDEAIFFEGSMLGPSAPGDHGRDHGLDAITEFVMRACTLGLSRA